MPQKKILILTASPDDRAKLRADKEIKAIEEELERSKNRNKFEIIPKLAVTPDDLIHILREQEPEIVHFCGHGTKKGLVFENESGEAQTVRAEALAKLFERFKDKVKCVLLNACYTDTQAEAINKHIQYVIGMTEQVEDKAAIKFATTFYATLIAGRSYQDAYDFGCIALDLLGIQDDLLPHFKEKSPPITPIQTLNPPTPFHYNNVINAFKTSSVIPFLGPGVNFYGSVELAQYIAKDMGISEYEDWSLQEIAQYIAYSSDLQIFYQKVNELYRKFGSSPTFIHQFFANLPSEMKHRGYSPPYKLLLTANYDDTLERAFRRVEQPFDLIFYVAEGAENKGRFQYKPYEESVRPITLNNKVLNSDRPVILKLYGTVNNFVITEEHHINFLVHQDIEHLLPKDLVEVLHSKNQIHNIFFLGYSPKDTNLRLIINRLWGEREIGQESWMIHQSKPGLLDKKFWKKRNVELLKNDLEEYFTELSQRIKELPYKMSSYQL